MITRICRHCGSPFHTYPSTKRQFCNRACYEIGKPSRAVPVEQRFWNRVGPATNQGCREWQGGQDTSGYGTVGIYGNRSTRAHRVAWMLANGRSLQHGEFVCHSCDNRLCCEPSHLWIGDHAANQADKRAKGRNVSPPHFGERNGQALLSEAEVLAIRLEYAKGLVDHLTLAKQYGVNRSTISMITRGTTWQHAPGPRTRGETLRHEHRN